MSVSQKQVQILGISIREDSSGFLCINDLFRASGSKPKNRPSEWLKLNKTKDYITYADKMSRDGKPSLIINQHVTDDNVVKLTYSTHHVFLEYAGWLSAEVRYAAYDALIEKIAKLEHKTPILETENTDLKIENHKLKSEFMPVCDGFTSISRHLKLLGVDKPELKTEILDKVTKRVNHRDVTSIKFDRIVKHGYENDVIIKHSNTNYDTVIVSPELVEQCLIEKGIDYKKLTN